MSTPHEPGDGKQPSSPPPAADKRPEAAAPPAKPAKPEPAKPEPSAPKSPPGPQGNRQGVTKAPTAGKPGKGAPTPESGNGAKPAAGAKPVDAAVPAPEPGGDGQKPGPKPVQTPPWQRGQQQKQAAPNGSVRPQPPVEQPSKPPSSRPVITGTAAPKPPQGDGRPARPVVTGTAAPKPPATDRRDAAKAKAAAIDGPTRSIARTDLAKDMPDLSAVPRQRPATGSARKAAPTALTAAVTEEGEPLRATVQLRRIDPWSTLKVSLVISVALFFVWMVAVGLLYLVLDGMGVWDRLNNAFTEFTTDSSGGGLVTSGQVFGYSALVGVMNVVLFTALATIGSFIYNLCSDLVGGVQVTLADPD